MSFDRPGPDPGTTGRYPAILQAIRAARRPVSVAELTEWFGMQGGKHGNNKALYRAVKVLHQRGRLVLHIANTTKNNTRFRYTIREK